jgi:hypothetical protein
MDMLINSLPAILKVAGDSPEVVEAACMAAFKYAAGEGLRDHAVPLGFNNNTLVIGVGDSTWQKQLQSLSSQLLFRINSILGKPLVSQLEFRVAPEVLPRISEPAGTKLTIDADASLDAVPIELITAAARIQDKDLRRAFLGAALSCIKRVEQ